MQQIVVSAMLQSQQCWLPLLEEPMGFGAVMKNIADPVTDLGSMIHGTSTNATSGGGGAERASGPLATLSGGRFIAHCIEEERVSLARLVGEGKAGQASGAGHSTILIGPEGDFTQNEIDMAMGAGFKAVLLGETRLRTETAGIVAAALLCVK